MARFVGKTFLKIFKRENYIDTTTGDASRREFTPKIGAMDWCALNDLLSYRSLMKCAHCGCSITAQEKRKKSGRTYTYYHCTAGKGACAGRVYIPEEKISNWISEALSEIQIPEHIVEWTKKALLESHRDEQAYHQGQLRLQETRYRTIQNNISKAYADRLEGAIEYEFWRQQNERMNQDLMAVEAQIASLRTANAAYVEKGIQLMELARQASTLFQKMTNDEKREMVNLVLSNPRIENGTLRYDYKKPFSIFRESLI